MRQIQSNFWSFGVRLCSFLKNEAGTFVVMVAIITPVLLVVIGVLFDSGMLFANRHSADRAAEAACQRALKPTRTMIPDAAVRRQHILDLFDEFTKQADLTVKSRQATVNWIDASLSAAFIYETKFANILGVKQVGYSVKVQCSGIPPFPHDGEVVLDSNFVKPDGKKIPMRYSYGGRPNCWDVYKAPQFGWDSGTGTGVEIQDWGDKCFAAVGTLPNSKFPSNFVVELDSYDNSTMTKIIELHPGTYTFSVWYHGRVADTTTNAIAIYLKQREPRSGMPIVLFSLSQPQSAGWTFYEKTVLVPRYSVYDLTLAAEGTSNGLGGLINAFSVRFENTTP